MSHISEQGECSGRGIPFQSHSEALGPPPLTRGVRPMERVSKSSFRAFLARRAYSVEHVDADWDGYRKPVNDQMHEVEQRFGQAVSFGYMDCDADQDQANEMNIRNVPSVSYYRSADLFGVVIGIKQNIAQNIERMMRGEHLDETNTLSRG